MSRVKLFNISLFFIVTVSFNLVNCNVPVLLWESSSISDKDDLIPALYQLDSDEFSNHIVKKIHNHKPLVVLFLEESLSVEDFSSKDDHGRVALPLIKNLSSSSAKTEFISSVYDPIAALKDLSESQEYKWVKYDGKKIPKGNSILEVRLDPPTGEEDRPELLRRHDQSISDIYSKLLAKYSHILAIYTGKYSSWVEPEYNRVRRDVDDGNSTGGLNLEYKFPDNTWVRIVSKTPVMLVEGDKVTNLTSTQDIKPDIQKSSRSIIAIFPDKISMRFKFSSSGKRWSLMNIVYNDNLVFKSDVSNPLGVPFITDKPIEFSNGATKIVFPNMQIQAWMATYAFGDKLTIYFTYPILMGIFVTVILGIILSWAIIMMMDIRTMDRFDDPKGKTITVAQEG